MLGNIRSDEINIKELYNIQPYHLIRMLYDDHFDKINLRAKNTHERENRVHILLNDVNINIICMEFTPIQIGSSSVRCPARTIPHCHRRRCRRRRHHHCRLLFPFIPKIQRAIQPASQPTNQNKILYA